MSKLHSLLMEKVADANLQTKMEGIQYSTTLREIVTVGDMEEYHQETEGV